MGFYGNATYYLPNGIARSVVEDSIVSESIHEEAVSGSADSDKKNHIAPESIGTNDIADNIIVSSKIMDGSIYGNANGEKKHIAPNTITGGENGNIAPNTITSYNLGNDSVLTANIKNGNITTEKIADGAVNANKIADGNIYGNANNGKKHIAKETITGGEGGNIAPNTITSYNMADNSILTVNIENGNITTEKIADEAIIPNKLDRTYHEMHLIDLTYYNQIEYSQLAQFITEKYLETKNTAICFHSRPNHLDKLKDAPSGYYKITYAGEIYGSEQSTTYWWKLEILSQKAANPPEEQQTTLYFVFNHDSTDSQTKYSNFKLIPASTWVLRNYLRDNQQNKEVKFDQINTILSNFPLSDSNKNYLTYIQVIEKTESLSEEKNDLRFWWNPIRLESDSTSPQAGDYILLGNPNRQAYYLFGINNSKHYILFCRTESGQDVWFTKEIKNNEDSVIKTLTNYGPSGSSMSDITLLNNIHYDLIEDDNYITRKNYYIKENTNNYFSQKCTLVTKYNSTNTIIKNLTNSVILLDLQGNKQTVVQDGSFNFPEGFPTECILYLNFKRLSNNYIYCECKYW